MSQGNDHGKIEPINSSNHLKPDTIWHTAAVPREEQPHDYDERYPAKKRRVSCGIEIVKCNICGYHFDSPAQLSDHLLHHDSDYRFNPIYKCSYGQCMFRTDDRPLMKHHISRVHLKSDQALISKKYRNRKFLRPTILCSTCPMVFATESELWQHTPSCKEYRCQFCGQHFWTIEKRYSHEMAYHEDEFEYDEEEEESAEQTEQREDVKTEENEQAAEETEENEEAAEETRQTERVVEETEQEPEQPMDAKTDAVAAEETEDSVEEVQQPTTQTASFPTVEPTETETEEQTQSETEIGEETETETERGTKTDDAPPIVVEGQSPQKENISENAPCEEFSKKEEEESDLPKEQQ